MTFFTDILQRWVVALPNIVDGPDVFPLLPGQTLLTGKAPMWSTTIATASSGRERRRSNWSYPRWRIRTRYEVLRDRPSQPELARLYAFFCHHQGRRSEFSYFDPYDNLAEDEEIGIGNGVQDTFQLTRSIGTPGLRFTEPVRSIVSAEVTVNGAVVSFTDAGLGRVTLASPPGVDAVVRWSGQFMFLCRFDIDEIDPEQMTRDLWSLEGIELITVKR